MTSQELQFDAVEVDTELAKTYLQKNNKMFRSIGHGTVDDDDNDGNNDVVSDNVNDVIEDNANNIIHITKDSTPYFYDDSIWSSSICCEKFIELSNKIKENAELFCQLEYLIRHVPPRTTKLDLEMLIRQLCSLPNYVTYGYSKLVMNNDSPLIDLGCVGFTLAVDILASVDTAVVCYLFTELCKSCGIYFVSVTFVKDAQKHNITSDFTKHKALAGGCLGVVTAKSDVDSAVDAFLTAPVKGIWKIRHILVQESVCDRFKKALAWKTRTGIRSSSDEPLQSLCSDSYVYESTLFMYEYVKTDSEDLENVILINAFRTAKELIAIIEGHSPFCVSLWSSDVTESNEIALGVSAPLVWVNDYGVIKEQERISQAYFSHISYLNGIEGQNQENRESARFKEFDEVCNLQKDWAKLSVAERRRISLKVFKGDREDSDDERQFYNYITNCETPRNDFVHVDSNSVVFGVVVPRDVYVIQLNRIINRDTVILDIVKRLLNGSGFLLHVLDRNDNDVVSYNSPLLNSTVPIRFTFQPPFGCLTWPVDPIRVIHTSFGTIFAN